MGIVDKDILGDTLIIVGKRIKSGKCVVSQEKMDEIFSEIENAVQIPISKETACSEMGISRSTFDSKVAKGEIPGGKRLRGFKEMFWFKSILKLK